MASPPWPSARPDGFPSPPRRHAPLPPIPQARPSLDSAPPRRNTETIRHIPRRPVPKATASTSASTSASPWPNIDTGMIGASQIPPDLIPTLPASSAAQRPPPPVPTSSHGRSMSNPFPSLFPTRRASQGKTKTAVRDDFDSDSDSDAEMLGLGPGSKSKAPVKSPGPPYARPQLGDKEYASGNCMTCGALSRWPKGLKVFKCTICVTINDLADLKSALRSQNQAPGARQESAPPSFRGPISLDITRRLVRDSLRGFLCASLGLRRPSIDSRERTSLDQPRPNGGMMRGEPGTPRLQRGATSPATTPGIEVSDPEMSTEDGGADVDAPRPGNLLPRANTSCLEPRPNGKVSSSPPLDPSGRCIDPDGKRLFKPLEDYIVNCFSPTLHSVNSSFMLRVPRASSRRATQPSRRRPSEPPKDAAAPYDPAVPELDAKLLMLGDFAENGSWWTGRKEEEAIPVRTPSHRDEQHSIVTFRSPNIDWIAVDAWYHTVINAGEIWPRLYEELTGSAPLDRTDANLLRIETQILEAQEHVRKTLLKATEILLKRPGRPITNPEDLRFLLIIPANPLLHSSPQNFTGHLQHDQSVQTAGPACYGSLRVSGPVTGQHSLIIKRILGLLSNTPAECHNHLVSWLQRFPESRFVQFKDLAGGFLAYRLMRQNDKTYETRVDVTAGLIPQLAAGRTPASLHDALGHPSRPTRGKKPAKEPPKKLIYHDDWQIKAAARVIGLLFAANNSNHHRPGTAALPPEDTLNGNSIKDQVQARGQIVPTSNFYATLLDDSDLVADFEAWEKKGKFSFCQYPFLLSIGAKIQILEHDARRQMHIKARDAFFDSIMSRRNVEQHLTLSVRRDCLVEDSLKSVSEVIGGGGEDIKKGLRIAFLGEEGVDAGGLKKEWFLLLVREVFNPDHGMFVYDEDSQYCYFNPYSFETSDQYFLVGVVFGLAIYNSIILDVAFPPFAFRKLLTAAPPPAPGLSTQPRPTMFYSLGDLAEFRPRLAKGLRQLLEFDGDVETTFCLDFAVDVDKYGYIERVPLCPGGENRPVTNANRREYVDLYVKYLLDTAVTRQFEPFKRGFFTVCGGNALSLFRAEEIELLVRGSDEPLDITALRVSAEYENWGKAPNPDQTEPTLHWFWESFEKANPGDQRRLLAFITGSDRIPAMGAASLTIRISCLGDDIGRYPTARTCFNALQLWRFRSKDRLEKLLWGAVNESEGFGLK